MLTSDYIAGLFDGEGSIKDHFYTRKGSPNGQNGCCIYISISNNHRVVLENVKETLGYGQVGKSTVNTGENHNINYSYSITNKSDAKKFIELVKDKVIIKKEECEIALKMLDIINKYHKGIKTTFDDSISLLDLAIEMQKYKSDKNGLKSEKILKLLNYKTMLIGGD